MKTFATLSLVVALSANTVYGMQLEVNYKSGAVSIAQKVPLSKEKPTTIEKSKTELRFEASCYDDQETIVQAFITNNELSTNYVARAAPVFCLKWNKAITLDETRGLAYVLTLKASPK